jgi:hypothetical protein
VVWREAMTARSRNRGRSGKGAIRARAGEIFAAGGDFDSSGHGPGCATAASGQFLPFRVRSSSVPGLGPFFSSLFVSIHSHVINLFTSPRSPVIWTLYPDQIPIFSPDVWEKIFTIIIPFLYLIYTLMWYTGIMKTILHRYALRYKNKVRHWYARQQVRDRLRRNPGIQCMCSRAGRAEGKCPHDERCKLMGNGDGKVYVWSVSARRGVSEYSDVGSMSRFFGEYFLAMLCMWFVFCCMLCELFEAGCHWFFRWSGLV